jgi:hypothetical protein
LDRHSDSAPGPLRVQVRDPLTMRERGRRGATARWGDMPRVIRMDSLPVSVQRTIALLIQAAREEAEAQEPDPGAGRS